MKLPSTRFSSILASVIQEHGWDDEKAAPVRLYLEQLPDKGKNSDCFQFMVLMKDLFALKKPLEQTAPIDSLIQKAIRNFDEAEGKDDLMLPITSTFKTSRKSDL